MYASWLAAYSCSALRRLEASKPHHHLRSIAKAAAKPTRRGVNRHLAASAKAEGDDAHRRPKAAQYGGGGAQ